MVTRRPSVRRLPRGQRRLSVNIQPGYVQSASTSSPEADDPAVVERDPRSHSTRFLHARAAARIARSAQTSPEVACFRHRDPHRGMTTLNATICRQPGRIQHLVEKQLQARRVRVSMQPRCRLEASVGFFVEASHPVVDLVEGTRSRSSDGRQRTKWSRHAVAAIARIEWSAAARSIGSSLSSGEVWIPGR